MSTQAAPQAAARPRCGCVLGIDVGYSNNRKTTGLALLQWDAQSISWDLKRTGSGCAGRTSDLVALVAKGTRLEAVAIDGPLAQKLQPVSGFRCADFLLSQGAFASRGSAAPASPASPLHLHATCLANLVLTFEAQGYWSVAEAIHSEKICAKAIVETHPVAFLSSLIAESSVPSVHRGTASDCFWCVSANSGTINHLLASLLPGRQLASGCAVKNVTNHEDRAALTCAFAALSLLAGQYVAVGDPTDGYVILSHESQWGRGGNQSPEAWAERELRKNMTDLGRRGQKKSPNPKYATAAQVSRSGEKWF